MPLLALKLIILSSKSIIIDCVWNKKLLYFIISGGFRGGGEGGSPPPPPQGFGPKADRP